jgi:polyhydroxyalkanoate synthesis regulator phasin
MNKKTLQLLREEQEMKEQIIDLRKHIKDLEMELEFMYIREPNEYKYISSLEKKIDKLYEEVESIENE